MLILKSLNFLIEDFGVLADLSTVCDMSSETLEEAHLRLLFLKCLSLRLGQFAFHLIALLSRRA